ncbi:double-strand break repair helicase AddA [Stakelama saccharophila]|uniref:DNA 3'-5' helicase n=1 Tax=Stakelama saccharophila TaxID=3075605 RepID=A0ABZ0B5R4_9SPHN|nr:double-strand break repair helicase AddA [Stakelama sp. W311]WNO52730.1 double-strand break repair helicase AddA [Stakelama sp. W311]
MAVSGNSTGALPRLAGTQRDASDPDRHVWLSASAGTGKTQVLTARVYRLLLRGVDPGAILCLTFTKAGAAEMASRISARLARWVRLPEADLRKDLFALGEDANDADLLARARTLFARVLDAPGGGIRIQTIHSFCQTLLAAFPMEAELVPGFRPLEAREESVMAREALAAMLAQEAADGGTRHAEAIGALSLRLGEGQAEAFLHACARSLRMLEALPEGIAPYLRRALDLPSGEIEAELVRACADDAFDVEALRRIAAWNADWNTAKGLARADIAAAWLAAGPEARARDLAKLHDIWARADGAMRSVGKGQAPQEAGYGDAVAAMHERCAGLLAMRARGAYADLLAAALDAGRAYAREYARAKRQAGAVDFDDLIQRALDLLLQPGMGDWVRFKLDQATQHVLIDEAQDTNWDQWRIVRAIADEFFAGEGASAGALRTLFTVGDYKQAIFGFQGTDPLYFRLAHRHFERLAGDPPPDAEARPLDTMSLSASYRSTRPVLDFVDRAIALLPAPGMGEHGDAAGHASEVKGPGRVELWPPVVEGGDADEEDWIDDAVRRQAADIARQVKAWIDAGERLESRGRSLRPEDVMILVKRRGDLASLLVARLYAEGVPVAGVDRLRLNAPLAVQDLLAAVRFVLQPDDDLSLASLLVSPLIGWSQDDLMHAARREHHSLWRHLRESCAPDRLEPLYDLLRRADLTTPYRFLEGILSGPLDGRRRLIARLGAEARDPIAELLNAALDFERLATPSLQRFLDWFDRGEVEIVRDPSQPRDAVRVMTAHGAKGLQAPFVILADATVDPTRNRRDILSWKPEEGGEVRLPIFRPRAGERGGSLDAALADADRRELEEHWRLFYVAATRAEERLVVAGALGPASKGEVPEASWYAVARSAFDALGVPAAEAAAPRVFTGLVPQRPVAAAPAGRGEPSAAAALPEWIRRAAPAEAKPPRPLAPSALGEDAVADPPPAPAMRDAAERGRLLHALFERLPAIPAQDRRAAALRWLEGAQGIAEADRREAVADDALAIIDDPRFADLFGPGSLAEAPIVAVVAGEVISGTVDRLLVTDGHVRVVDFKTGRRVPGSLDALPEYHLRQMAAYSAALGVIFPGRRIEAALLYTAGPVLFDLPDRLLGPHKPGYGPAQESLRDDA